MKLGDYLDKGQVERVLRLYMRNSNQTRKEAQETLKNYLGDVLGEEADNSE